MLALPERPRPSSSLRILCSAGGEEAKAAPLDRRREGASAGRMAGVMTSPLAKTVAAACAEPAPGAMVRKLRPPRALCVCWCPRPRVMDGRREEVPSAAASSPLLRGDDGYEAPQLDGPGETSDSRLLAAPRQLLSETRKSASEGKAYKARIHSPWSTAHGFVVVCTRRTESTQRLASRTGSRGNLLWTLGATNTLARHWQSSNGNGSHARRRDGA